MNYNTKLVGLFPAANNGLSISEEEEKELIDRAKNGSNQAYSDIVAIHTPRIMSMLKRKFELTRDDAEDIAQESFIKAWKSINNFRGDSRFYTWIYRIASNTSKNEFKKKSVQPQNNGFSYETLKENGSMPELFFKNASSDPVDTIIAELELPQAMNVAMNNMPVECSRAVSLNCFNGHSYQEIAEIEDIPIGTVRSRIFRGKEYMQSECKSLGFDVV